MQTQPSADESREFYAEPVDPPDYVDPYALNLAGLVAFNPTYPALHKALGPTVEIDEPIMLGGPQVSFSKASRPGEWPDHTSSNAAVVIKLDVSGQDRVTNHGRDITDQQAAKLLGITENAFARGHELATTGLKHGIAAMDNPNRNQEPAAAAAPYEAVEAPSPQQRLAASQRRDLPAAGGPNLGIGPPR